MAMNPYTVLAVEKNASAQDIQAAFRKLAKKHHPDLNPGNKKAEQRFKEINSANEILGDPVKRAKYDRGEIDESGAAQRPQQEESHYRGGPSFYETQQEGGRYASSFGEIDPEFLKNLFGGRGAHSSPTSGVDSHYLLDVEFRDAALGAHREITLPGGRILKVQIPAGIESGKKLRLKGLGEEGEQGAPRGDALVEIRVKPSRIFSRVDNNVLLELPITLQEAVLGGEVKTPTLEGAVKLKVPPGSNTGSKLRIQGKGIGDPKTKTRGDLIVSLKIVMPPQIDNELSEAIAKWSKAHAYDPRAELEKEAIR